MIEMFTDVECLDELGGFLGILFLYFFCPSTKTALLGLGSLPLATLYFGNTPFFIPF